MKFKHLVFTALLLLGSNAVAFDHEHTLWGSVLSNYLSDEALFKYEDLKKDVNENKNHEFVKYISSIQQLKGNEFSELNKNQQLAFLINAYNALTVKLILDNYPLKSIKEIGTFFKSAWKQNFFSLLDGQIKNLDTIEHKWIRPKYKDYRIHAAVNCASISCPSLRFEPYLGSKLDDQLDQQMKLWLNDKTKNQVNSKNNVYTVSKIFDWYKDDFEKWGNGVLKVINKFSPKSKNSEARKIKIRYMNYNWNLNQAK